MAGRRRWILSGGLLLAAGALTAIATRRHWASCRTDLSGAACLALRADPHGVPSWGEAGHGDVLGVAAAGLAAVLLATAWWGVSDWARGNSPRVALAAVVGLQPVLVAALMGLELLVPGPALADTAGWLTWPAEILVLPLLLGAGWVVDEPPLSTIRLIVLGWGVTSFGSLHHFADYVTSSMASGNAGTTPPGTGYVTALSQVALGLAVMVLGGLAGAGPEQEEDDESYGQDGFTLAA